MALKMSSNDITAAHRAPGIPPDYVMSEFIAYPLASKTAFKNCITSLDPRMEGETLQLWRGAESRILRSVPDLSLEQAISMRDRLWFLNPEASKIPLHEFLESTAHELFEASGALAMPRGFDFGSDGNRDNAYSRNQSLRWLSFSLPPDLLLGAMGNGQEPPSEAFYACPIFYKRLDDDGFSENHVHVGAALEFREYWVAVLNALASNDFKERDFKSAGAEFREGEMLAPWLLRAAIARYILALFLYDYFSLSFEYRDFSDYLRENILLGISKTMGPTSSESVKILMEELYAGAFSRHDLVFAFLRVIYRYITVGWAIRLPDDPGDIHGADPIARLVPNHCHGESTPEIYYVNRGIAYLKAHPKDELFSAIFWQTLRLRCIFYRHIVQRPMTPGLQWFVRMYSRIWPGRRGMGFKLKVRSAIKTCGGGHGLKSLELRTSPDPVSSDNLQKVKDIIVAAGKHRADSVPSADHEKVTDIYVAMRNLRAAPDNAVDRESKGDLEYGLVFHFPRIRGGGGAPDGCPGAFWLGTEADPRVFKGASRLPLSRCRYSHYYRKKKREAMAMARMIFHFPKCLKVVRGVDLCTDELGIPAWVLAPHLRYLRDACKAASRQLRLSLGEEAPGLRTSVHSGEDFVHLLGGLRRVDEAIRYFKLQTGDRIGHGLALGLDPADWAKRKGRVAMYLEDRLFDLMWEWNKYSHHRVHCSTGRLAYIEREISRLTERIFEKVLPPYVMERFIRDLHDEDALRETGYPDYKMVENGDPSGEKSVQNSMEQPERAARGLLHDYLKDHDVFKRGHRIEWVNVVDEIEPMEKLQENIRKKIAVLGIVVEINPTSNLLIGNLTDLKNHPLWRLNPPKDGGDSPPVSICIGSDDPLTFATNLRQEYALLRENLVAGGLSNSEACNYLNQVRLTGLNSRFTLKVKEDPSSILDYQAFGIDRNVPLMP